MIAIAEHRGQRAQRRQRRQYISDLIHFPRRLRRRPPFDEKLRNDAHGGRKAEQKHVLRRQEQRQQPGRDKKGDGKRQ